MTTASLFDLELPLHLRATPNWLESFINYHPMEDTIPKSRDCIGGITPVQLDEVLSQLTSPCTECEHPKFKKCLDKCCIGAGLYCQHCESDCHFLHLTSDIRLAFAGKGVFVDDRQWLSKFDELSETIKKQEIRTTEELSSLTLRHQQLWELRLALQAQTLHLT